MADPVQDPDPIVIPNQNALEHLIPDEVKFMFVWDDREVRSTLEEYLLREPHAQYDVQVPGDARLCNVISGTVTNTTAAAVYWVIRLHDLNFSFGGVVPVLDWFCVHATGVLKGTRQLFDILVPLNTDALRIEDMQGLGVFAQMQLYQNPVLAALPLEVQDLLNLLANFAVDQYLRLKTHPALENAIGKHNLYLLLYGLLLSLKGRDPTQFNNIMASMTISCPGWICNAVQNIYLHWMLRVSSSPLPGPNGLVTNITKFLSGTIKCGATGDGETCLRVRRNGHSHLFPDYRGVEAATGTEEALRAAIEAAQLREPQLRMLPPYPVDMQALQPTVQAPFRKEEAHAIATAIHAALQRYANSRVQAQTAATAAATYLAVQPTIYAANPQKLHGWHLQSAINQYNQQLFNQYNQSAINQYNQQQTD